MANAAIDIPNLLYRYADAIDAAEFEAAADLFRHGHVIAEGHKIKGSQDIAAMWQSWIVMYPDGTPRTRHLTTNPIIDLSDDGTSATCQSQWTIIQATDKLPLQPIASGRYYDRFEIIDGAWCFTERNYAQIDFVGDTNGHLKQQLAE